MSHVLSLPAPWFVVGPIMGLSVAGLYATTNLHLGVSGSYVQFLDAVRRRPLETWRFWFLAGLLGGALVVSLLGGGSEGIFGYGRLAAVMPGYVLVPFLLAGGVLLGYGARWAGACTSGHGLSGCSTRSPGSFITTCAFFMTAVGVTFLLHIVTAGAL